VSAFFDRNVLVYERVIQIGEASMLPGGARWSDIKDLSGEALNSCR
jgi:hypothetical protein